MSKVTPLHVKISNEEQLAALTAAAQALAAASIELSRAIARFSEENSWVTPELVKQRFGLSACQLRDRIADGRFTYGVHFVNISDGEKACYRYNLVAIGRIVAQPPECRKPVKQRRGSAR